MIIDGIELEFKKTLKLDKRNCNNWSGNWDSLNGIDPALIGNNNQNMSLYMQISEGFV